MVNKLQAINMGRKVVINVSMSFGLLALSTLTVQAAPAVCPDKSAGDHPFDKRNYSQCIWVINDHHKVPARNTSVDYNIYCPGRMTQQQANDAGQAFVRGVPIKEGNSPAKSPNIINRQHWDRGLAPYYVSTPHVFHYGCVTGGQNGVATHIKVRVKAGVPLKTQAEERKKAHAAKGKRINAVAASCKFHGSQNGDIAIGARMDREYKCTNMLLSSERDIAKDVARVLVQRDLLDEIRKVRGQACVLRTTDIQCAPCRKSDKLVVRLQTKKKGLGCPASKYWGGPIK